VETRDDSGRKPRRGRKRKFSRDEVQRRLIEAATDEMLRSGLTYGLQSVRLDRSIVLADVPRGAAYELWSDGELAPQDALRRETILSIVRDMPSGNASATQEVGLAAISELDADINSGDIQRVRRARGEVIRRVAIFNQQALDSQTWRCYRGIVATVSTQPDPDPVVLAAIEAGERTLIEAYEQLFVDFTSIFRMRLNPGYSLRLFGMSIVAINEGLTNRTGAFDEQSLIINGQEWTAFGVASEALCEQYFTIDLG